MKIGYIVHNLNDPAVERRCTMLERGGASVMLAGFMRDTRLAEGPDRRAPLVLGRTQDAAMARRAWDTLRAVAFRGPIKRFFAECDVIMARNLEQLAIAGAVAAGRPIVYECLDIHRSLTGIGKGAAFIRAVEARLLPRVALLLTSSPAFVRHHFAHRPLAAPIELVENKLLLAEGQAPASQPAPPKIPLTIGWFGMLRCRRTLDFLTDLVTRAEGRIEVLIAGKPSPAELPDLAQRVAAAPGMTYHGPYSYDDLPDLYGRCHFAWTIDWFEDGLNSSWLLPNRLYEALAHGVVPIALAEVETGRWLAAHDCGLLVDRADAAADRLVSMDLEELTGLQQKVGQIERTALIADDADCAALVRAIAGTMNR